MRPVLAQINPPDDLSHDQLYGWILVTLIVTLVPALVTIIVVLLQTKKQAQEANDAVNHRHARMNGEGDPPPKMYDAILSVMEKMEDLDRWKDKWDGLPEDLADEHKLVDRFNKIDQALFKNDQDHARIVSMIERGIVNENP